MILGDHGMGHDSQQNNYGALSLHNYHVPLIIYAPGLHIENEEIEIPIMEIGQDVGQKQLDALNQLRSERDEDTVQQALTDIQEACADGSNLLKPIVAAAKADATLGEIVVSLKAEFGEWQEAAVF